jgi:hypothetical protein
MYSKPRMQRLGSIRLIKGSGLSEQDAGAYLPTMF